MATKAPTKAPAEPPRSPNPPPATGGAKSIGAWARTHHAEVYLGAASLVVAIALYVKSRKSSSATTSGAQATPSTIMYLPTTSGGGDVGSPSSPGTPGPSPGSGTTPKKKKTNSNHNPADPSGGSQFATTALGGADYYILGSFLGTGRYQGDNVSTNEPVFFTWTGNGTPTQGPPPSGASGVVAYTPVGTPTGDIGNPTNNIPSWSEGYT